MTWMISGSNRVIRTVSLWILLLDTGIGSIKARWDLVNLSVPTLILIWLKLSVSACFENSLRDRVISSTVVLELIALFWWRDHVSLSWSKDVTLDISHVQTPGWPVGSSNLPLHMRTCLTRCPVITWVVQVIGDRREQAGLDLDCCSILVQILPLSAILLHSDYIHYLK